MDIMMNTILAGIISLFLWKFLTFLLKYKELCSKLRRIPQKPSHWLHGHGKEVTDSISYHNYVKDIMKGGSRMYCMWNGPFPVLGVCHPETFQQLNKQVSKKARGFTDAYRILEPWLELWVTLSAFRSFIITYCKLMKLDISQNKRKLNREYSKDKLDEASEESEPVDILPHVCRATLDSMLKCLFSYEGSMLDSKEHTYIRAVQRLTTISWERLVQPFLLFDFLFSLSPVGRESNRVIAVAHKFTGDIIEYRRKLLKLLNVKKKLPNLTKQKRRLDFLDILLTAKDEQGHGLSRQEIQEEVDTFSFAGHDTTGSAISWAIYALGQHLDLQEKVFRDVQSVTQKSTEIKQNNLSRFEYLPLFIKEVMRFYSPVPLVARKHSEPITIDGIEIPSGPRVDINIYAIHHNPQVWKHPEEFDPDRFAVDRRDETDIYGYIPFSSGSRNCIGQVFAMNEIKITLAKFVNRFEVLPVKDHKAVRLPDGVMRSLTGLPVILKRRQEKSNI